MSYKTLGNYFYYDKEIAYGSFSIIYRGYKLDNRNPVAIKKFIKHVDKKYLDSEVEIMKKLDHINILKLYDVVLYNSKMHLILEYCNMGNLKNYIDSKMTKHDDNYINQTLNGLKYLYNKNILHRDIKPQNILINNYTIKICDFGFAKDIKDTDLLNTFCGSPLYMAPEMLIHREYSSKSDVWSLGVIIYEIIFKHHPYLVKNQIELFKKIKDPKDIYIEPNVLYDLLSQILIKDPTKRISWKILFMTDWVNSQYEDCISSFNTSEDVDLKFEDMFESHNDNLENESIISHKKPEFNSIDEDYQCNKLYPHSAPDRYLENYINKKSQKIETNYKILGNSPKLSNSSGFSSYLSKSMGTFKNLFG